MLEGDFTISCSQCGGEDFQEAYPVPADTYRIYGAVDRKVREVTTEVYICIQCGHVEKFVDLQEIESSDADAQAPGDHFDARS
ncbi:MAG: hypothetical protein ACI906_003230 [Candidatus Latescibacterota bacterium]|jgi:hypothetical protein